MNKLPSNWNDITVFEYQEIQKALKKWNSGELVFSEFSIEILSIFHNTTPDDEVFYDTTDDELDEFVRTINWIFSNPVGRRKIDSEFTLKEMNKLTLGEFIDVEHFLDEGIEENLHIIAAILFKKTRTDDWGNLIEEPYSYNIFERGEGILDWSITEVISVINEYFTFKESFMENYGNLFNDKLDSSEDTLDIPELTGREKIMAQKEQLEEEVKNKWSWESLVWGLSGEDITKMDAVFNTSLILTFNILSMKKVIPS